MRTLTTCFLLLFCSSAGLWAAPVQTPHVEAELVTENTSIQPGKPFTVALRMKMDPHWHTYWKNPGDSGIATSIQWTLPEGFSAGPIVWPAPHAIPFAGLINYGYEGEIFLLTTITPPATLPIGKPATLKARADWLVCEDVCLPGGADLQLSLPVKATAPQPSPAAKKLEEVQSQLPVPAGSGADFQKDAQHLKLFVPLAKQPTVQPGQGRFFFADDEEIVEPSKEQTLESTEGGVLIQLPLVDNAHIPDTLSGVLRLGDQVFQVEASMSDAASVSGNNAAPGLFGALLLGFLGGLVLNLMPCVFPVLGLKIMSFVKQSGESRRGTVFHGLVFTAGVLISFWVLAGVLLALRAGGEELGWGFQLQSPVFVYCLAVLLFAFGLNMSGLFEVGLSATGVGSGLAAQPKLSGSFFSGVLATVVATPCAAPFLAPALGAALALPTLPSLLLFTSIAIGLSTPYLVLAAFPALTRHLPRPGAWMESFKQAMAFLLYGATAYLVWVLEGQVGENTLLAVLLSFVLVAVAGWIYGRWATPVKPAKVRGTALALAIAALAAGLAYGWPSGTASQHTFPQWEPWSPARVEELRKEGRVIYVDFTARWCATCQTNKKVVFGSEEIKKRFEELQVVTLKADWTNQDPAITEELARWGRSAIPFNLVYRPDRPEPEILPELLTPGIVLKALEGLPDAKTTLR